MFCYMSTGLTGIDRTTSHGTSTWRQVLSGGYIIYEGCTIKNTKPWENTDGRQIEKRGD